MGALRSIFIGLGIAVLGATFLTLVLGSTLFVAAAPIVAHEYPTLLVDEGRACGSPCFETSVTRAFLIPDEANRLELAIHVAMAGGSGPVRVLLHDQWGRTQYDHVFVPGGVQDDAASWAGAHGRWTLRTTMAGFMGTFQEQVVARGVDG